VCWAGWGGDMHLGGGVRSGGHRTRMAAVESIIETRSQFDRTEIVMTRTKINNRHRKNKTSPLSLHYNTAVYNNIIIRSHNNNNILYYTPLFRVCIYVLYHAYASHNILLCKTVYM